MLFKACKDVELSFSQCCRSKTNDRLWGMCQQNQTKLQHAANLPDKEKSACVKLQEEHLANAKAEPEYFRKACSDAENVFEPMRKTFNFTEKP